MTLIIKRLLSKISIGWLFVLPFILIFIIFGIYPMFYTFGLSVMSYINGEGFQFVWFSNFFKLFSDSVFQKTIFNTFYIWLSCFIFQILSALVISAILTYSKVKGKNLWMSIFYFPNLIAASVLGLLFQNLLASDTGSLNIFLKNIGLISESIPFLSDKWLARAVVSFMLWLETFGIYILYMSSNMNSISTEIYESARVDGCKGYMAFFHITLPLMRPVLYFIFILSIVGGMQIFTEPYLYSSQTGAPNNSLTTLVMYIYRTAFTYGNFEYAAAVSIFMLGLIMLLTTLVAKLNKYFKNKYI